MCERFEVDGVQLTGIGSFGCINGTDSDSGSGWAVDSDGGSTWSCGSSLGMMFRMNTSDSSLALKLYASAASTSVSNNQICMLFRSTCISAFHVFLILS